MIYRFTESLSIMLFSDYSKDFDGIQQEGGINTFATTSLMRGGLSHPAVKQLIPRSQRQLAALAGGSLSKYSLGVLEGILAGAVNTRHQLEKMNLAENTICVHCANNADETKQHMFWVCPAWEYIRKATIGRFGSSLWTRHPQVVTQCSGITLMPPWLLTEWQRLSEMVQREVPRVPWATAQTQVLQDERGILVWTDGSTSHASIPDLTRSGVGIFFQEQSDLNFSAALAGEHQTNNRAELLAVTLAAELGSYWQQSLVIHTDSDWVFRRASTLHNMPEVPHQWEHHDLWLRLHRACSTITVIFVFVPSHLSLDNCADHGVAPSLVVGNNGADRLAKQGVLLHFSADWTAQVNNYAQLLEDTMWIQFCMICICLARNQCETEQPPDEGPSSFPTVLRGWEQLSSRLEQAADSHPTGRRRYNTKAPPAALEITDAALDVEIDLEAGSARPARPRRAEAHAVRHPPRLGEATNTEWQNVPKPWLLLTKSESTQRKQPAGMRIQLGVKPALLPAMEWYLGQLIWPEDGRSQTVAFLELAIDFEISTGVKLTMPKSATPEQLGQRGRAFYAAASAIGRYVERRPWPIGFSSQPVRALYHSFGLPVTAGLAWRPVLLHETEVHDFFAAAGGVVYASDADFFRQRAPLLVADREAEWNEKVRRVPIFVRRQEMAQATAAHGPLEWCVQSTAAEAAASGADSAPVSAKLSKKITDWNKKKDRVDLHNATAADDGKHWIELPPAPDFSLSGEQYAQAVRNAKVQCKWCKRTRCLSVADDFMKVPCHAPRED